MTGIFPNDLKVAIISPIHKSGCKTRCNNYRPVSVLSAVAKIPMANKSMVYKHR